MARLDKTVCCCVLLCIAPALCHSARGAETKRYARAMFERRGMVDVARLDPSLIVDLRYGSTRNFAGADMYGDMKWAYLTAEAAHSLVKAQKLLKKYDKNYSIMVLDAARPVSTQWRMWRVVRRGIGRQYVARPFKGGPHNYGVAVDVTLAYCGKEMDMGTEFDSFSDMAHTDHERQLVAQGRMTKAALYHRYLLRKVMTQSGFMIYKREWWHFERHRIAWARRNLKQLDF